MRRTINKLLNSSLSLDQISKESGVPYSTVNDLANDKTKLDNMRFRDVEKLYLYALEKEKERLIFEKMLSK